MRKTTFYCDRCGCLTNDITQIGNRRLDTESGQAIDEEWAAELCPKCYQEIDGAIIHMIWHPEYKFPLQVVSPTAKPKKTVNSRKIELDLGKIAALHNAGWSLRKIADEMHVSDVTIKNRLDEAMEFLANKELQEANENE